MHLGYDGVAPKRLYDLTLANLRVLFLDGLQLLPVGLLVPLGLLSVDARHDLLRVVVCDQTGEVLLKEAETVQILRVHHVHAIVTIEELDDRAIVVTHGQIVVHDQRLQLLDETTLQIATT